MNFRIFYFCMSGFLLFPYLCEAKTLRECFLAAFQRSEKINLQGELLVQAEELERQALAPMVPTLTGSALLLRQKVPRSSTGAAISPAAQNTIKITATQSLFRGFRDLSVLNQRKSQSEAQKFARLDAARILFYDTASAFYQVRALESDLFHYQGEVEANKKRLKDLEGFVKIGRSRLSELLSQKATIASLEAQVESVKGQLLVNREVLAFLTGFESNENLSDDEQVPGDLGTVDSFLKGISRRPDVQQASENLSAYDQGPTVARAQHFPAVDLIGNYYLDRPGLQKDSVWDVQLSMTFPLFQGGAAQSMIRQAVSVQRQYTLMLSQTKRLAESEIRQFFATFSADQRQIFKLEESTNLFEKNYQAQLKDYRNGLVTNMDVLQAMSNWQDISRTLDHQKLILKTDYVKLQAASGLRKELTLEEGAL